MRNRLVIAIFLTLSLVISGLTVVQASVISGSKCSNVGTKKLYEGRIYTCVKLGNGLSWNNGKILPTSNSSSMNNSSVEKDFRKPCRTDQEIELIQIERYLFSARQTLNDLQLKWEIANSSLGIDPKQAPVMKKLEGEMNRVNLYIKNLTSKRVNIQKNCRSKNEVSKSGSSNSTSPSKRHCTATEILMIRSLASKYIALNRQIEFFETEISSQKELISEYLLLGKMDSIARANFIIEEQSSLRDSALTQAVLVSKQFKTANSGCINSGIKSLEDSIAQAAADQAESEKAAAEKAAAEKAAADELAKVCAAGGICKIGNTGPGGGEVFYDAGSRQSWGRYLEFAPEGWSGSQSDPKVVWCNDGDVLLNSAPTVHGWLSFGLKIGDGLGQKIGDGRANTELMLAGCRSGAALMSRAYRGGGQNDWFLPSSGELNELCKYAGSQITGDSKVLCQLFPLIPSRKLGKTTDSNFYWSSSETSSNTALAQFFGGGTWNHAFKANLYALRPIRAF